MTDYARGIEQATALYKEVIQGCEFENAKLRELVKTFGMFANDSMMCNFHHRGVIGYWWGCAFKYLWRWPYKGVREDLEKAKACIDYLLEYLPGGEDS